MTQRFNKRKFIEVLHYIINKTSSSAYSNVGKTVLYKLLYFNDFNFYERTETMMTGETYSKLPHGPAPRHFNAVINEMEKMGLIETRAVNYHGMEQMKYISLVKPEPSLLTRDEIANINDTLKKYGKMNAREIETHSHKDTPWAVAEDNQNLDYELVFYRTKEMAVREYPNDDY